MDSWVANWIYADNLRGAAARSPELAEALRALVDLRFGERLDELLRFVRVHPDLRSEPGPPEGGPSGPKPFDLRSPDGGPPEPGTPPAGPRAFFEPEPPDGGPPEPGAPLPPPPQPEPPGPDDGFLGENPWILYWFVSLKAPALLDVIDAHFNRRLDELAARSRG
jgi:hypothetical protein